MRRWLACLISCSSGCGPGENVFTIPKGGLDAAISVEKGSTFTLKIYSERGKSPYPGDPIPGLKTLGKDAIEGLELVGRVTPEEANGEVFAVMKFRMVGDKPSTFTCVESTGPGKYLSKTVTVSPLAPRDPSTSPGGVPWPIPWPPMSIPAIPPPRRPRSTDHGPQEDRAQDRPAGRGEAGRGRGDGRPLLQGPDEPESPPSPARCASPAPSAASRSGSPRRRSPTSPTGPTRSAAPSASPPSRGTTTSTSSPPPRPQIAEMCAADPGLTPAMIRRKFPAADPAKRKATFADLLRRTKARKRLDN